MIGMRRLGRINSAVHDVFPVHFCHALRFQYDAQHAADTRTGASALRTMVPEELDDTAEVPCSCDTCLTALAAVFQSRAVL